MANTATESIVLPRRHLALLYLSIFLLSFAVRTLTWQDNHNDAWKVQTSVTARYKESARQLVAKDFKRFVSDVPRLGHPPGYPILIGTIYALAGESDSIVQFIQITIDSAAVVVLQHILRWSATNSAHSALLLPFLASQYNSSTQQQ